MAKKKAKKAKGKKVKAKKKTVGSIATTAASSTPKKYRAAFYSNPKYIEPSFVEKICALEAELKMPVVLLWHGSDKKFGVLDDLNYLTFTKHINKLSKQQRVAVLIDSPGGTAGSAFKLACLLSKHCGSFIVAIPYIAKSAATLFSLGAERIIMSRFAEMGPLDVQIHDPEKEERFSALEVVQAIERLNSESMRAIDQQMLFWLKRSGKKVDTLLPIVMHFVSEMMKPLFDKIDTVYYTGMARVLKVAQDYAQRLLEKRGLSVEKSGQIADKLTNAYSEHGYVIDCDEMNRIGLKNVEEATGTLAEIMEDLIFKAPDGTFLGPLEEI